MNDMNMNNEPPVYDSGDIKPTDPIPTEGENDAGLTEELPVYGDTPTDDRDKHKKIIAIAAGVVLIAGLGIGAFALSSHKTANTQPTEQEQTVTPVKDNSEEKTDNRNLLSRSRRPVSGSILRLVPLAHEVDCIYDNGKARTLLAVLRLPLIEAKLAVNADLHALSNDTAHSLGTRAEHGALDEVRIVLPLVGLAIESAIVDSNTERENLRPLRSHAKLRIARKMTGNVNAVDRHARGPFSSWLLTDTKIPQHISITRGNDEFFKEK